MPNFLRLSTTAAASVEDVSTSDDPTEIAISGEHSRNSDSLKRGFEDIMARSKVLCGILFQDIYDLLSFGA